MSPFRISPHRALRSPKLAIWLIVALVGFVLVAFIIPQRALLTPEEYARWVESAPSLTGALESVGLDSVFTSWAFLITLLLLFANLAACTIHRWLRRPSYPPRVSASVPADARHLVVDESLLSPVPTAPGRGWNLASQDGSTWVYWRGAAGRWGSLVMHVGMLLLLFGGLASALTRFGGTISIVEGQTVVDAPDYYLTVDDMPRIGRAFSGATLTLDSIEFEYERGVVSDAVASMRVQGSDGSTQEHQVKVNYPLKFGGKAYLLETAGHAVVLRITDPSGAVVATPVISLGETGSDGSADSAMFGDLALDLILISDRAYEGATDPRKFEMNDPILYADVTTKDATGTVSLVPGSSGSAAGWTIDFVETRLWNRFMARSDGGRLVSVIAFVLIIAGMAVRWFDSDAIIVVRRTDVGFSVWGRSRQGGIALAAPMERVIHSLSGELSRENAS